MTEVVDQSHASLDALLMNAATWPYDDLDDRCKHDNEVYADGAATLDAIDALRARRQKGDEK